MRTFDEAKLKRITEEVLKKKYIHGAVFHITSGDGKQNMSFAAGNMKTDSPYYIASINKLFISAVILKMIEEKRLSFSDHLSKFISEDQLKGLHVLNGKDLSDRITIEHLLSHTSGLPCYLEDKPSDGKAAIRELEEGTDRPWPTEDVLERVKKLNPHFYPGEKKKAKYSDTNHQLLNLVIEGVTGSSVTDALNQLFKALEMNHTYVCQDVSDKNYIYPYYKNEVRNISRYITSTENDIISTAGDQMIFLRKFFEGYFYPKEKMESLMKWNKIFFPFQYGIGIQKFYMPRYLSPQKAVPDMIGHCGSTGSVAFYVPESDIYITGTTNQQANPSAAFQTLIKIVHS